MCVEMLLCSDNMPCPFLTRLSSSYVRNYGNTLLKSYGQHCPVMSRLHSTIADSTVTNKEKGICVFSFSRVMTHFF